MDWKEQSSTEEGGKKEMVSPLLFLRKRYGNGRRPKFRVMALFSLVFLCLWSSLSFGVQAKGQSELEAVRTRKKEVLNAFSAAKGEYVFASTPRDYVTPFVKKGKKKEDPAAREALNRIKTLLRRNQINEAMKAAKEFSNKHPFHASGQCMIGDIYQKQKNGSEAQKSYLSAVIGAQGWKTPWKKLSALLKEDGKEFYSRKIQRFAWVGKKESNAGGLDIEGEEELWGELPGEKAPTPLFYKPGSLSPEAMGAWLVYVRNRVLWREEGKFQKEFPDEKEYRGSLKEELECFSLLADMWKLIRAEKPEVKNRALDDLVRIKERGMLIGYVLLEEYRGCAEKDKLGQEDVMACLGYFNSYMLSK